MKKFLFLIGILVISFLGYFYFLGDTNQVGQKCPDEYATMEEQMAALDAWTNNFYDNNSGARLEDWSKARYEFWVENDCVEVLEKYQVARESRADPETMRRIQDAIQNAIDNLAQ